MTVTGFPETADIETSSEGYARRFSGAVGAWFLRVQEEATLRMLPPCPQARVLDVGGGHGQLAGALVRDGYRVTVLSSAEICKARISHLLDDGRCSFQVGNLLELPFEDRAFDVVVSYRLLAHVSQWRKFLLELTRVASRAVIVDYPTTRSVNYVAPRLFQLKRRLEGNTRQFLSFGETELEAVFRSTEFAVAGRYPQFFFPMVLHRTLKRPKLSMALEELCRRSGLTDRFGSPVIMQALRDSR